jgi:hypothetical protein
MSQPNQVPQNEDEDTLHEMRQVSLELLRRSEDLEHDRDYWKRRAMRTEKYWRIGRYCIYGAMFVGFLFYLCGRFGPTREHRPKENDVQSNDTRGGEDAATPPKVGGEPTTAQQD